MPQSPFATTEAEQALALFDALPDVVLFMKDRRSRFTRVNRAFLAMHGCQSMAEVIGRNDHDFHPPALAAQYVAEDERVMRSGRPMREQVWLVPDHTGLPAWYRCTKLPLVDAAGRVSGLAGILRPFVHAGKAPDEYCRLTPALQMVAGEYHRPIRVSELARACGLSISHLQREFRRLFGMSPSDYVLRTRLLLARRMLDQSTASVGEVAVTCGFYDQSHFTKAFKAHTGLPPQAYRQRSVARAARGQ
jgi:PAS domain S-box-containing protein